MLRLNPIIQPKASKFFYPSRESRYFPGRHIAMQHTKLCAAHDHRLCRLQSFLRAIRITNFNR